MKVSPETGPGKAQKGTARRALPTEINLLILLIITTKDKRQIKKRD
jgi:hypothetical protein